MWKIPCQVAAILAILVLLGVAACTSATAPATATASARPTGAVRPTEAAGSPASKLEAPGAKPSRATAAPAVSSSWKAEWDRILDGAKKEGKVVVAGRPGDAFRDAMKAFEKTYPDIKVEFSGISETEFVPKVVAEREGGQYIWDILVGGAPTGYGLLKPKGVLDPLGPGLTLPEVLDTTKWQGGFEDGWMDKEPQLIYGFTGYLTFLAYVNRDVVPESELNSIDQLLAPKWKSKITTQDPRAVGPGSVRTQLLLMVKGEDFVRKLLSQDLAIARENRGEVESVVRGQYPIGIGLEPAELLRFQRQGLGANVKPLAPDSEAGAVITTGAGAVMLINKAPHPNAANLYLNWLLSKEAQVTYVAAAGVNSRRLDVPGPPETAPQPGVKYQNIQKEELLPYRNRAVEIAKETIK